MAETDDELTAAMEFLYRRLTTGSTGADVTAAGVTGVFDDAPPADVAAPYLTIGVQAAPDVTTGDGLIILTEVVARVIAVTDLPAYPAEVALAAHRAIHKANDYTPGGRVHQCRREQSIRYSERENDRRWRYQGGLYRVTVATPA